MRRSIANDMHLRARVPIIWYRARLRVKASDAQPALDLNGVTLPGAPLLVAGSNGHIAWGFTNSYGDWLRRRRKAGLLVRQLPSSSEEIRVHGAPSVSFAVKSGPAGVLYRAEPDGRSCWFVSWLAQQPAATNMNLMALERATSVDEALALGADSGHPASELRRRRPTGSHRLDHRRPHSDGYRSERATGTPTWTTRGDASAHRRSANRPDLDRQRTCHRRSERNWLRSAESMPPWAPTTTWRARARQIRDDLLASSRPGDARRTCCASNSMTARCS